MTSHADALVPPNCTPGPFGIRRSHRLQPRYDRSEPVTLIQSPYWLMGKDVKLTGDAAVKRVTYVRDVCVRCGERIERQKPLKTRNERMNQPRLRSPVLSKQHRTLARTFNEMGFDTSLTGKSHLRLTHRQTGKVIFGPGTPSDHRSYANLIAQVRRLLREIEVSR